MLWSNDSNDCFRRSVPSILHLADLVFTSASGGELSRVTHSLNICCNTERMCCYMQRSYTCSSHFFKKLNKAFSEIWSAVTVMRDGCGWTVQQLTRQQWNVTGYNYLSTALKYNFERLSISNFYVILHYFSVGNIVHFTALHLFEICRYSRHTVLCKSFRSPLQKQSG